jgi:ubiquinone/menaquinone biosynthesis C-methylase UbiE
MTPASASASRNSGPILARDELWAVVVILGSMAGSGCPHREDGATRDRTEWDRVATKKKYFSAVVSPWDKGVLNPLGDAVRAVPAHQRGAAIDLGTGIGNGVPMLAQGFGRVVAIDYAPKMVAAARKRHGHLKNVTFAVADMRKLGLYRNRFDVAVAVNSVLLPSNGDVTRMLRETYRTLKPGGFFFGVFPSLESEAYIALLTFEREHRDLKDERRAWARTEQLIDRDRIDFLRGTVGRSAVTQKFYFRFELIRRLQLAGFRDIKVGKVVYPWRLLDDPDARAFRGNPGFWDWFVAARRPASVQPVR